MGIFRLGMSEISRTTSLIGELIALTTEQEETLTYLGEEAYKLYRARKIYDEVTLELCRKIDSTHQLIDDKKRELEDALDEGFGNTDKGARESAKKLARSTLIKRELAGYERMLKDDLDELGNRVVWMAKNDPRSLTKRTLRLVGNLDKLKRDIDWRWDELQERTRNEQKGPVFILVLNMFIVNFFRFTNHTWFRNWLRKMEFFQDKFMEKIHRENQANLKLTDEEVAALQNPAPSTEAPPTPAEASPDPFKPRIAAPEEEAARPDPFKGHAGLRKVTPHHGTPADGAGGFFAPGSTRANPLDENAE